MFPFLVSTVYATILLRNEYSTESACVKFLTPHRAHEDVIGAESSDAQIASDNPTRIQFDCYRTHWKWRFNGDARLPDDFDRDFEISCDESLGLRPMVWLSWTHAHAARQLGTTRMKGFCVPIGYEETLDVVGTMPDHSQHDLHSDVPFPVQFTLDWNYYMALYIAEKFPKHEGIVKGLGTKLSLKRLGPDDEGNVSQWTRRVIPFLSGPIVIPNCFTSDHCCHIARYPGIPWSATSFKYGEESLNAVTDLHNDEQMNFDCALPSPHDTQSPVRKYAMLCPRHLGLLRYVHRTVPSFDTAPDSKLWKTKGYCRHTKVRLKSEMLKQGSLDVSLFRLTESQLVPGKQAVLYGYVMRDYMASKSQGSTSRTARSVTYEPEVQTHWLVDGSTSCHEFTISDA